MSGLPQTSYNEIIDELNSYDNYPDEFTIKRLEQKAHNLVKIDPAEGYMALGGIAALKNDLDGVKQWHTKSINLQRGNPDASYNFAVSLQKVGLTSEAAHHLEIAFNEGIKRDENLAGMMMETMVGAGRFMKAINFRSALPQPPVGYSMLPAVVEFMKSNGFTDEDFAPLAFQAEEVARKHTSFVKTIGLVTSFDDSAVLELFIDKGDPKELANMNEELAERLASVDSRPGVVSSLVIYFRPEQSHAD